MYFHSSQGNLSIKVTKVFTVIMRHLIIYTVTKIIPLSNLLEPNIMDLPLWLDLSPNILDSSVNLWVKDMMS
jgi:hypothetical protein